VKGLKQKGDTERTFRAPPSEKAIEKKQKKKKNFTSR